MRWPRLDRPRLIHAVLLLPLIGIGAWIISRSSHTREDPAAVLHALRMAQGPVLPAANRVGATTRSEVASYNRKTIFDYIDGAAEAYITRGFEQCVTTNYAFGQAPAGNFEVITDIYRFANPQGATAQLEAEKPSLAKPVKGIIGAFADDTTLVVTFGRDYAKLTALGGGDAAVGALVQIAQALGSGSKS